MHKLWKDKIRQGMVFEILFSAGVCVCIMKSQEKVPLKASSDTYRENKTRNLKRAIAKQLPSFEVWPTITFQFLNCLLDNVEKFNSLIRLAAQFLFNTRSSWETINFGSSEIVFLRWCFCLKMQRPSWMLLFPNIMDAKETNVAINYISQILAFKSSK